MVNNFFWHEGWTWRDRARPSGLMPRLVRFHLSAGLTSIVGSVLFTALLVEWADAPVLMANAAAVGLTAAANYALADRWVFARPVAPLVATQVVLFAFGAFGDLHVNRRDLVPIAIERARLAGHAVASASDVVVIGDTPLDVDCARVHGARALAVATGPFSTDALGAAGASVAVETLEDAGGLARWIATGA